MLYFKIIFIDYKSDIQKIVNIYIYMEDSKVSVN